MEPYQFSVKQAKEFSAKNQNGPSELTQSLAKRIQNFDSKVKAYVHFDPTRVLLPKDGKKGPLYGVPISIKDNIVIENWETTCASKVLTGFIPPYDATVIRKLREAGAVIFGKCNMD